MFSLRGLVLTERVCSIFSMFSMSTICNSMSMINFCSLTSLQWGRGRITKFESCVVEEKNGNNDYAYQWQKSRAIYSYLQNIMTSNLLFVFTNIFSGIPNLVLML